MNQFAEFFRKSRELYPDAFLRTERIYVSGSNAVTEWTLQATLIEPAFGNCRWKVPISPHHGASVVTTENGMITSWSDYVRVVGTQLVDNILEMKVKRYSQKLKVDRPSACSCCRHESIAGPAPPSASIPLRPNALRGEPTSAGTCRRLRE